MVKHTVKELPPFVQHLVNKEFWPQLIESSTIETFSKKSHLIYEGERDNCSRLILSGWTGVIKGSNALALIENTFQCANIHLDDEAYPSPYDLIAATAVTSFNMKRSVLRHALENSPTSGLMLVSAQANRNLDAIMFFGSLKDGPSLESRLAKLLWRIGKTIETGEKRLPEGIGQDIVANLVGTTREELNRKKRLLVGTGYISKRDGIEYMDPMTPLLFD